MDPCPRLAVLAVAALALAPSVPAGAQGACGGAYTIRAGDTLEAIAARCGASIEALMQANPRIADPGLIAVGSELAVPGGEGEGAGDGEDIAEDRARARDDRAAPAPAGASYTVEAGDNMASIATALGVPLRALLAANADIDPFAIRPGQTLVLPAPEQAASPAAGEVGEGGAPARYTVEPGDSLANIAEKHGLTLDELIAANAGVGVEPLALQPGQVLVLPGSAGAAAAEPEVAVETPARYIVEPGDSLANIAEKHGLTLDELIAANQGIEPRALQPGRELVLPGGHESAGAPPDAAGETAGAADPDSADEGGSAGATGAAAELRAAPVEAAPERVTLEGRIRKGVECPVLRTPEGATYSLVSQDYGFTPGDYVAIEGEEVAMSLCAQGRTVRVTSMTSRAAPRGG